MTNAGTVEFDVFLSEGWYPEFRYPLTNLRGLVQLPNCVHHDVARTSGCNVKITSGSALLFFPLSLQYSRAMNLEEEVFKIGKQLEKIVGEEGTVSLTFNC